MPELLCRVQKFVANTLFRIDMRANRIFHLIWIVMGKFGEMGTRSTKMAQNNLNPAKLVKRHV